MSVKICSWSKGNVRLLVIQHLGSLLLELIARQTGALFVQQCETIKKLLCSFFLVLKLCCTLSNTFVVPALHTVPVIWEVIVTSQVIISLITRAISAMINSQHAKTKTRRKNNDAKQQQLLKNLHSPFKINAKAAIWWEEASFNKVELKRF